MSWQSFLLKQKFKWLKLKLSVGNSVPSDYGVAVRGMLSKDDFPDIERQDLLAQEVLASTKDVNSAIDLLNSGFDQNVLERYLPLVIERIEAQDSKDILKRFLVMPGAFEDYPEKNVAVQMMAVLENSLKEADTLQAFAVVDTLLKGYEAEPKSLLFNKFSVQPKINKFRHLHKEIIARLLEEKTPVGLNTVISVFDPTDVRVENASPENSVVTGVLHRSHADDHLEDIAETLVFPFVKNNKSAAVFFQVLLEKRDLLVEDAEMTFGSSARELLRAWEGVVADTQGRIFQLRQSLADEEDRLVLAQSRLNIDSLKANFVAAAEKCKRPHFSTDHIRGCSSFGEKQELSFKK